MSTRVVQNGPDLGDLSDFTFARRTWVHASPSVVYELISDVSMIATWSPNASDVTYDDGAGPHPGAWFSGRNRKGDREWTARSQVLEARPGAGFAFVVGGVDDGIVRWTWTMRPYGDGTEVSQEWRLLRTDPVLGETRGDVEELRDYMVISVETTLVSLARWVGENRRA
ncbi:SRPBCC family protein [Amycolatopsis sp. EV170708-02-1]|uniref:SRPBCC family protein n=1 Tax=Amycolatopsis sp. EV170708-02-1 TaxID=2919322 RepID=UPI001F0C5089|nr:SRPBCC family protein [Amycolatopsis sp. EV170708-02-1]UMP06870.1 SRPBCC family protein [Amycolatopsis sp. EV170708-02-1]